MNFCKSSVVSEISNKQKTRNLINLKPFKNLTILAGRNCVLLNRSLAASDLSAMFRHSLKFYQFQIWKGDSSNRQKMKGCEAIHKVCPHIFSDFWFPVPLVHTCPHLADPFLHCFNLMQNFSAKSHRL